MNTRCVRLRMAAVLLAGLLGACGADSARDDSAYIPEPGDLRRITLLETAVEQRVAKLCSAVAEGLPADRELIADEGRLGTQKARVLINYVG